MSAVQGKVQHLVVRYLDGENLSADQRSAAADWCDKNGYPGIALHMRAELLSEAFREAFIRQFGPVLETACNWAKACSKKLDHTVRR